MNDQIPKGDLFLFILFVIIIILLMIFIFVQLKRIEYVKAIAEQIENAEDMCTIYRIICDTPATRVI